MQSKGFAYTERLWTFCGWKLGSERIFHNFILRTLFIFDHIEKLKITFTFFLFFIMQGWLIHLFTSQPITAAALLYHKWVYVKSHEGSVPKKTIKSVAHTQGGGGCSHLLRFVLHAPNLLVWLEEAPKQILYSLLTQYFIYFLIYLTI